MTSAINPYDSYRHSLSDPRDDTFGPREDAPIVFRTPQVPIQLPPPACRAVRGCIKPPMHLGNCEVDPKDTLMLSTLCPRCRRWTDSDHTDDCDLDLLDPELPF